MDVSPCTFAVPVLLKPDTVKVRGLVALFCIAAVEIESCSYAYTGSMVVAPEGRVLRDGPIFSLLAVLSQNRFGLSCESKPPAPANKREPEESEENVGAWEAMSAPFAPNQLRSTGVV